MINMLGQRGIRGDSFQTVGFPDFTELRHSLGALANEIKMSHGLNYAGFCGGNADNNDRKKDMIYKY